ncbi:aquaporin [Candidatus Saccharibacteria bacterium]|nr:aquaporin [Candidatus Saccharibacteria bacterium]
MAKTTKSPKKTAKAAKTTAAKTSDKASNSVSAVEATAPEKVTRSEVKSETVESATKTTATTARRRRSNSLSFMERVRIGLRDASPSRILAEFVGTYILTSIVVAILGGKFSPISYFVPQNVLEQQLNVGQGQSLTAAVDQLLQQSGVIPFVATAVFAALAYVIITLIIGRISGAHINPAITIARMTQRVTRLGEGTLYIVAQVLGAMLALAIVSTVGGIDPDNLVLHRADWNLFYGELLGSLVFGFGVASAALYTRAMGKQALVIGGSYLLGAIIATMGGARGFLNPALAVGTNATATGDNSQWWMLVASYVVAPVLGATIGYALYRLISREHRRSAEA